MKKIVILTGAGISAESGIKTFRDADGLWEGYSVEAVASPEGWKKNQALVLDFYNQRRKQLKSVVPNAGHECLVLLESHFQTTIITQNVDDLHERAGSKNIMHLHGELLKVRSSSDKSLVYDWEEDLNAGDLCDKKSQLRPHIVWFGEEVPNIKVASILCHDADIIIIVGTSMQVYPAAGLVSYAQPNCKIFYVDPNPKISSEFNRKGVKTIEGTAANELPRLVKVLIEEYAN